MKIYSICVVKNEEDIIRASLTAAAEWSDKIIVLDNGSEDHTWEIVQELAKTNDRIIAWKQSFEVFSDAIRAQVFNAFKHYAKDGDWWCARLDADEFYVQSPQAFLPQVEPYAHVVCSKHIQYRLTSALNSADNEAPKEWTEATLRKAFQFYDPLSTSEIRFFRHRSGLVWNESAILPTHAGIVSDQRILVKHYQYRSVKQVEKRIATRLQLKNKHPEIFPHVFSVDVNDYIVPSQSLIKDTHKLNDYLAVPFVPGVKLKYRWWVLIIRRFLHVIGFYK